MRKNKQVGPRWILNRIKNEGHKIIYIGEDFMPRHFPYIILLDENADIPEEDLLTLRYSAKNLFMIWYTRQGLWLYGFKDKTDAMLFRLKHGGHPHTVPLDNAQG
jgi:hypothetical protein